MSRVLHTSDLHIGHVLVARHRWAAAGMSMDDFPATDAELAEWHDALLAERWDVEVDSDDIVIVHGDLAVSGSTGQVRRALEWVEARKGRKRLIPGNHDPIHPSNRDSARWHLTYYKTFEAVELACRRKFTMPDGSTRNVLCSHFPYHGDRHGPDRETQWRLRDEGGWLLHGHLHSRKAWSEDRYHQIDVGVDAWDFTPVSELALVYLIEHLEHHDA